MTTLHVSLRCLKHPATLLSIGLLLANDHWLKASFPSWWTGKLSDFAGLFFFPFLLAPFFGLLLDRRNISPRTSGRLAIGLTAIWFALFKTLPLVNAATRTFLAILLGHPVQLVLDATDLIALSALAPAWLLWTQEAQAGEGAPSKRAWVALAVGVLATAATSPLPPLVNVQRLDEQGGKLNAYGSSSYSYSGNPSGLLASSEDGGRTWASVPSSKDAPAASRQPAREACDPANTQVCYRVLPEQVDASRDGGKTYQVAWSIPWGRKLFMQRENTNTGLGQEKQVDMGPYDLVFTRPVGANGLSTVVFAMGNEGVLVHTPEGAWERYEVGTARPTPFSAPDIYTAFRTVPAETDVATFLVLLTFSFLSFRAASTFKRLGQSRHSVAWAIWPLVVLDIVLLIGWAAWAWIGFYHLGAFSVTGVILLSVLDIFLPIPLVPIIALVLLGVVLYWIWTRIAQLPPEPAIARTAFWRTLFVSVGLLLATWGSLFLWTFGIIPLYEIAVALAVALALVLIIVGIQVIPGTVRTSRDN